MKIVTWNVNGIKARHGGVAEWLRDDAPDVAVLQEIKSVDEAFPREVAEEAGYELHTHGQKGFNGVALLSKTPLEDVTRGLPAIDGSRDTEDEQARYIEGTVIGATGAVRICGLYLPNGNPAPGPKYDYKLAWMARLEARARALLAEEVPFLMTGDFNVLPQDMDAARPGAMAEDALALPDTRTAWRRLVNLGLTEAFRARHPGQPGHYSYWDYQAGAFDRNHGLRIDHFLLSPWIADRMTDCTIQGELRAREKPSDHVPVWLDLNL
ncbi:MAG: exodeoxyribonuclease III [Jannaschia sp.]